MRLLLIALVAAVPALAQFDLQVSGANGTHALSDIYDLGSTYTGESISASFVLRNVSANAATVNAITAAGIGFTVDSLQLPITLDPQATLRFTVTFRASDVGSYSAVLRAGSVTVLLTGAVVPSLTYRVENAPLSAEVDFGSVTRGASSRRNFTISNDTAVILTVPAVAVVGSEYAISASPAGTPLAPHDAVSFSITFTPSATGTRTASLTIGDRRYLLTGFGLDPPLPKPRLTVELAQAASAQQGTIVVTFDHPADSVGAGTITLDFTGPTDPTIAFASGGRSLTFPVARGDTGARFLFQTGTSAGTMVFTVTVGDSSDQATVRIPGTAPAFTTVQATRSAGSIDVRIAGFDNTRTAGPLTFTFFDSAGKEIAPGAMRMDATGEFSRFFGASDAGGTFLLKATFPVSGDASQIASVIASLTNSSGTRLTSPLPIQ